MGFVNKTREMSQRCHRPTLVQTTAAGPSRMDVDVCRSLSGCHSPSRQAATVARALIVFCGNSKEKMWEVVSYMLMPSVGGNGSRSEVEASVRSSSYWAVDLFRVKDPSSSGQSKGCINLMGTRGARAERDPGQCLCVYVCR